MADTGTGVGGTRRPALEPPALALGQPAPDAEPLVLAERVLQAVALDLAADADALGLPRRTALLREERLRVGLRAQRLLLPRQQRAGVVVQGRQVQRLAHLVSSCQISVGAPLGTALRG
jgi:hypothetical protein